ncbi:Z658B protein, partial [Polypterus senegalus]
MVVIKEKSLNKEFCMPNKGVLDLSSTGRQEETSEIVSLAEEKATVKDSDLSLLRSMEMRPNHLKMETGNLKSVHCKKNPSKFKLPQLKHEATDTQCVSMKEEEDCELDIVEMEPDDNEVQPVSVKEEDCELKIVQVDQDSDDEAIYMKQEDCELNIIQVEQDSDEESLYLKQEDCDQESAYFSTSSRVRYSINMQGETTEMGADVESHELDTLDWDDGRSEDDCSGLRYEEEASCSTVMNRNIPRNSNMMFGQIDGIVREPEVIDPSQEVVCEKYSCGVCGRTFTRKVNVTWKNVGEKSNISITVPPHSFPKYLIMLKKLGNPTFDQNIQFGSKTSSKTNAEKQILNNSKDPSQQNIRVKVIHECPECGKIFPHKYSLQRHRKIHTGEKKYECTECGKKFIKRGMLQQHQSSHTGEKPFGCSECGRWYTRKGALKIHQRIHTGERPFVCFECGKRFTQKCSLQTHKRTHTGEKPYSCTFCEKTFAHQSGYQLHQKVHVRESSSSCNSMEKPYSCTECGKKFAKQGGLEAHKRVHTAKNTAHQSSFRLNVHSGENSSTVASDDPNLMCSSVTDGTYNEKPPGPL